MAIGKLLPVLHRRYALPALAKILAPGVKDAVRLDWVGDRT